MVVLRIAAFLAGIALVGWALRSAVETVILPRSTQNTLARSVFRTTGGLFRFLANERRDYVTRDRIMALYAPASLLLLPAVWVATILLGYLAMFLALGRTIGDAFFVSGSSLLTLGFAPLDTVVERILAFSEATLGLGIVALLITFLPSLYSAFSRRETEVALLETRAGSPPSAIEFLVRLHRLEWLDQMERLWERWETWFADVQESHTSYAALNFFRSPQSDQSWIVAAGTVLDAASLTLAAVDVPRQPQAAIVFGLGMCPCVGSPTFSGSHKIRIPNRAILSRSVGRSSTMPATGLLKPACPCTTIVTKSGAISRDGGSTTTRCCWPWPI